MKLSNLYKTIKAQLEKAQIGTADLDARWMIERRTGYRWADIVADGAQMTAPTALEAIEADLQRRIAGEPLSRIYGEREFWGRAFKLSPETLDPRPDTETLIEAVLARYKDAPPKTVLDLGTGTGCILVTLLCEFPEATGIGVDLSLGALKTAQENAQAHGAADRTRFNEGSWFAPLEGEHFDLIVSNPPYIAESVIPTLSKAVQNHDPILALSGGEDGLAAYKSIFSQLSAHLNPHGRAFFEIGFDQEDAVTRLGKEYRIRIEVCHRDLAGQPRVLEMSCGDK